MEVSSIHPVRFLLVTRILAAILMVPLLIIYADALGVFGSWIGINLKGDVSLSLFFSQAFSHVHFSDLIPAFIKSFFFGAIIGVILMMAQKKGLRSEIPFGPFLIVGTFLAMFLGNEIIQWYLHLFLI